MFYLALFTCNEFNEAQPGKSDTKAIGNTFKCRTLTSQNKLFFHLAETVSSFCLSKPIQDST